MPRFAANLSMMYTELAHRLADHGLRQVLFNAPPGDSDAGELDFNCLFDLIDELGYSGHIGCEHGPHAGTSARPGWFQRYKESQR